MPRNGVVHVIDDDEAVRQSLAFLLATAGLAVRVYDSGLAFLDALTGLQPGCVVSDIRMPGIDGLELQRRLRTQGIDLPVIIMTGHADVPLAVEAMKAGVFDFVEKPFSDDALIGAVRAAIAHQEEAKTPDRARLDAERKLADLSPRERDVLIGVVAGKANKVIAYDLDISPRTVEIYRSNLMTKMSANSLSDLVRMAITAGILNNDGKDAP